VSIENEQRAMSAFESQRQALFSKAISELAGDIARKSAVSEDEAASQAAATMVERWGVAQRHYRGVVDSVQLPPAEVFENAFEHAQYVKTMQAGNAKRMSQLWQELQAVFEVGRLHKRAAESQFRLSSDVAKELVVFLAKEQGYK